MTNHFEWSRSLAGTRPGGPGPNTLRTGLTGPRGTRRPARETQIPLVHNSLVAVGMRRSFGRRMALGSGVGLLVGVLLLALLL